MNNEIMNYDIEYARLADAYAQKEVAAGKGGRFLGTKGGILCYGDEAFPGNQACVIVLASVRENTYYVNRYNADNIEPPVCYAFGNNEKPMVPHASVLDRPGYFMAQSATCQECPHNAFTKDDSGKWLPKKCQNRRRLALLPAGFFVPKKGSRDFDLQMIDDPKAFREAEIAYLKLPPTSVAGEWEPYVTNTVQNYRRPPYLVTTRLFLTPHAKHQQHTCFETISVLSHDVAAVVKTRIAEAEAGLISAYQPPEVKEKAQQHGIAGLYKE